MQHIFIVNNVAGGGRKTVELIPRIDSYFSNAGGSYEIVTTKCKGDATEIARRYAQTGEHIRLYSCGGDGTLHEVINGVVGYKNVEVGAFPCGTGNDYVSTYGKAEDFLDVKAQVEGSAVDVDLILADGVYSINQCSIGFDAAVANNVSRFKQKPLITNSGAYILSVMYTLAGKLGNRLRIYVDDNPPVEGSYLFAVAAKGQYQGGGMMNAPLARPTSRTLSCMFVRTVSRVKFLSLFPKYMKGQHLTAADVVTSCTAKKMRVISDKPVPVALDGEIIISSDITAEVVPKALNFVIPSTVSVKSDEKDDKVVIKSRPKATADKTE